MTDLKPCPFCGGEADIPWADSDNSRKSVMCAQCGVETDLFARTEEAAAAWNKRQPLECGRTCRWSYDEDTDAWDSECGGKILWGPDGTPKFCPECGGAVMGE